MPKTVCALAGKQPDRFGAQADEAPVTSATLPCSAAIPILSSLVGSTELRISKSTLA